MKKIVFLFLAVNLYFSPALKAEAAEVTLQEAIEQSAEKIVSDLPRGSIVAVLSFDTSEQAFSNYIIRELNGALFDRGIVVVNRQSMEFIEKELNFQMSGAVSDETAKSIGKFIGAGVIIVGELKDVGKTFRYRTEAVFVEEARHGSIVRLDVKNDRATQRMISALANSQTPTRADEAPPNTPLFFIQRGITLAMRGEYELAIENFSDAIKLNPDLVGAYMLKGRALAASVSVVSGTEGDFDQITTVLGARAVTEEMRKIYDLAIEEYNQAIRLSPNLFKAYLDRGVVFVNKGDNDRALADFNQAIRLNPNNAAGYSTRGSTYNRKGDYDRAIADFNQAIKLDPNIAIIYNNRGLAYHNKGDYDRAITDYNQAIRLTPKDALIFNNRGTTYNIKGDHDRAISDLNQAIKLAPNMGVAYNNRGLAYYNKRDYDRAILDYNQAIRLDPNGSLAFNNRGFAYNNKGDYDRAIADHNQAIRLDPNNSLSYNFRGIAYFRKGNYDRAIADINYAIRLDPNNQLFKENLEYIQQQMQGR